MTAPAVTITDFMTLLQPGELSAIRETIETAMGNLTTTAMASVVPADIKALAPLITAIRNAALSTALAPLAGGTATSYIAENKRITDIYATIPTTITAYATPTDAPAVLPTNASIQGPLATTNATYNQLIMYIDNTIDDIGSTLLVNIIQQNADKTDAASISALTALVIAYINYVTAVVAAFKLTPIKYNQNYDRIVQNIEATLGKMSITIPSVSAIDIKALVPLVEPYTGPAPVAPVKPMPSGRIIYNTNSGFGPTYPEFSTHFPNGDSVILQKGPLVLPAGSNQWVPGPWAERLPPVGSVITNLPWMKPNTKVVSVSEGYPLADAGLYNPVGATGYLVKFDQPLESTYQYPQGEQRGNRWSVIFTYPPIPAEEQAYTEFPAKLEAWKASVRPTTDPIIAEIGKSINISINKLITDKVLGNYNTLAAITAIKGIPAIIDAMVLYLNSKMDYFQTMGVKDFVASQLTPIYPLAPATQQFFTSLDRNNFVANLSTSDTGILPTLVKNYTSNFSLNIIKKIVNKSPTTGQAKALASSVATKLFQLHLSILNTLIKTFKIDMSRDNSVQGLIKVLMDVFSKAPFNLEPTPVQGGGSAKKRRTRRKQKRRPRTKGRSKHLYRGRK